MSISQQKSPVMHCGPCQPHHVYNINKRFKINNVVKSLANLGVQRTSDGNYFNHF